MRNKEKLKGYILAIAGGLWFGIVVFVIVGNFILRETRLGVVARVLDRLPYPLREILFLAAWVVFFTGWIAPAVYSLRTLNRAQKQKGETNNSAGLR
jgi:hypothetical protein